MSTIVVVPKPKPRAASKPKVAAKAKARPVSRRAATPAATHTALAAGVEAARDPDALLPLPVVSALVGWGRSKVYAAVRGGAFPEPVRLGARCTRWRAGDVRAWLAATAATAATAGA